jgi:hypothetical protein
MSKNDAEEAVSVVSFYAFLFKKTPISIVVQTAEKLMFIK